MQLTMEDTGKANRIRGYDVGSVTVNDTVYRQSIVVARDNLITDWPPGAVDRLATTHLDQLLELDPELIIIGTGSTQQFPDRDVLRHAILAGIGIEVMTTPAACRTYNVLMAENRRAVAALFMMEKA
ncbi:MAG: Mth938-like domain-containing protein [Aquisalimonadaceae bacterium]